jgi:uncharacterized protein YqfA (UPF0365 family)
MTKPTITIHDLATGETVEREMNAAEFKQYEADQLAAQTRAEAETAKAVAKSALLAKLGINEDEAKLLLS